ncbi:DNA polymerase III subunit delta' [Solimicrobium silvestre]|uniref:HolB: DNA polymerase III, delta' subunit n=1 Tax=Solimicrobium silvestre TaxID=2099400 RepID=A0A2S9GUD3_9BURK|nr:DNA polymerase III subunit delta' [Solimicrobium silvestre]PRC91311.1 holB: DNA polymerase III, delta' subunit [Solimicrobium silvestre]
MSRSLYPWQHQAWAQLQQMQGRWPHAILLHGPEGIGKTQFAEWLAQSLLCESPEPDGQACGTCISCGWFGQYSHPDFRRLRPEILEDAVESDGEDTAKTSKATKAPSKEIVINQVRSLSDFMTLSTHRQGRRVIVIYPADAMNVAAANALLKSLEEPGPNTVFILVTCNVDSLLPTMVSRCRQFALTLPSSEQAMSWLLQQEIKHPDQFLAEQGGAPLAAYAASQSESHEQQHEFLLQLQRPDLDGALKIADKLQKTSIPLLLSWMQRWLYDVFSYKLTGKIRYYPRYYKEIDVLALSITIPALLTLLYSNMQRRAVAEHPLSAKLLIEEMLLDYIALCKKRS